MLREFAAVLEDAGRALLIALLKQQSRMRRYGVRADGAFELEIGPDPFWSSTWRS